MMLQSLEWNPRILSECGIDEEMVRNLGVELTTFMKPFQSCTTYTGQEIYAEVFVKGFLSYLQYKSAEPIALRYGVSVRGTQRFLSSGKWDTNTVGEIYRAELSKTITSPTGMITIDESGEPKKGTQSVGVARQYCGNLGKTDNSQVGVFIGYCNEDGGYGIIDRTLYMPEKWFDDDYAPLRKECKIPDGASFQTKPEIATAPQARLLVVAYLNFAHPASFESAINLVDYYIKRYYESHFFHRNRRVKNL